MFYGIDSILWNILSFPYKCFVDPIPSSTPPTDRHRHRYGEECLMFVGWIVCLPTENECTSSLATHWLAWVFVPSNIVSGLVQLWLAAEETQKSGYKNRIADCPSMDNSNHDDDRCCCWWWWWQLGHGDHLPNEDYPSLPLKFDWTWLVEMRTVHNIIQIHNRLQENHRSFWKNLYNIPPQSNKGKPKDVNM